MRKMIAVLLAFGLAACSGSTVTGPTEETVSVPSTPTVAAPLPSPTPAPVASPVPVPEHDARVKGGFYSVTNTTGVDQFYCAAAFGVLPGGDQSAGTNIYEDQGIRKNKDVFSGQAPKTAACQYEKIQVDLTQSKDCRKFDWHNVLAAEVYANPAFPCPKPEPTPTPTPSPSPSPSPEPTCEQSNPNKGAVSASVSKTTTLHAGTPEQAYWYWDMDNGQGDNPKQNACEGRGGVWLGDNYNIPNDGSNNTYNDVCRVTTGPSFPGGPGADTDFIKKVVTSAAVPDKYSVTVTLSYSIAAGAAQSKTFKIVYGGTFVKKQVTVSVACGEAKQGTLIWQQGDQYNDSPNYAANDGHVTGTYTAMVQ